MRTEQKSNQGKLPKKMPPTMLAKPKVPKKRSSEEILNEKQAKDEKEYESRQPVQFATERESKTKKENPKSDNSTKAPDLRN